MVWFWQSAVRNYRVCLQTTEMFAVARFFAVCTSEQKALRSDEGPVKADLEYNAVLSPGVFPDNGKQPHSLTHML